LKKTTLLAAVLAIAGAAPLAAQTTSAPLYWSCNYTPAPYVTTCSYSLNTGLPYPSGPTSPLGFVSLQGGAGRQPIYWACGFSAQGYQTSCTYAPRVGASHASGITNVYNAPALGYVHETGGPGRQPIYWSCVFTPAPYVTTCTWKATVGIPQYAQQSSLLGYVSTTN
jgi:uncharacterized protein YcsI (UPF0317 family)